MKLTREEQELLDSVERGEWKRVADFEHEAARYREAAWATLRKDKRVNIRMTERDLVHLQRPLCVKGSPIRLSSPASCTSISMGGLWKRHNEAMPLVLSWKTSFRQGMEVGMKTIRANYEQIPNVMPGPNKWDIRMHTIAAMIDAHADCTDWSEKEWQTFTLEQLFQDVEDDPATYSLQDAQEVYDR